MQFTMHANVFGRPCVHRAELAFVNTRHWCMHGCLSVAYIIKALDTESYHESIDTALTQNGSPPLWRFVYCKDMAEKNGANPLIFFPAWGVELL